MLANLNGWHALILVLVLLMLFGATRLPALARGLGQSLHILRSEATALTDEPKRENVEEFDGR